MSSEGLTDDEERGLRLALDALLGRDAERSHAEDVLAAFPHGPATRRALSVHLSRARRGFLARAGWSERRERRWRTALFARSTRIDLSWRGDLRLVHDFLRQRLRASTALRVVAASLALHVVAAPVVAYWVLWKPEPEKRLTLRIEPASDALNLPEPGPRDDPEDELLRLARRDEARENERARSRFVLAEAAARVPRTAAGPGDAQAVVLLALRGETLRAEALPPQAIEWSSLEPLELALWIELELDRLVRWGQATSALGPACARAMSAAHQLAPLRPGTAELLHRAAGRAGRLGLFDSAPEVAADLLAPVWFEALERSGREHALDGTHVWQAWLTWRGKQAP